MTPTVCPDVYVCRRGPLSLAPSRWLVVAVLVSLSACADSEPVALTLAAEVPEVAEVVPAPTVPVPVKPAVTRQLAPGATLETLEHIGLAHPVAVLHDPAADVYLVGNRNRDGAPAFVTSLLPDGSIDAMRWIDGASDGVTLRSPAGMALVQNRLVVADGEHVRVFDRETGAPRGEVHIPGAIRLNDVAAGSRGDVYVTDSGIGPAHTAPFGAVYRVSRRGTVSVVAKSSVLGRPTGLVRIGSIVWIAAVELDAIYGVASDGHLTHGPSLPVAGSFSGMTHGDGQLFLSSPSSRTVYGGPIGGPFVPTVFSVDAPGDVGWDGSRGRLLVPRADEDTLELH
ncbi:MAG: hypothetical protein QF464_17400, partial [Myxococcota bacterium]|nr:hypothetical protein [Myxococcota bacterium]